MKVTNIMMKTLFVLGIAFALIACEAETDTDPTKSTNTDDTEEADNNNNDDDDNNDDNNNNDTTGATDMLPPEFVAQNCDDFEFTPCGGDIVGAWSATGACMVAPDGEDMGPGPGGEFADPSCPAQQAGVRMSMAGTTLNFNADLSYNHSLAFGMEMAVWRPSACDQGVSCDLLQNALNEEGGDDSETTTEEGSGGDEGEEGDEGMALDWTCSSKNDGCLCLATGGEAPEQESGTYTTADNMVIMDIETEEGEDEDGAPPFKYCVDGTTLQFEAVAPADEPLQMFITFDKQ